jgi:hypothetical protein
MESRSLNHLEPSGPQQACYGTALPLPSVSICYSFTLLQQTVNLDSVKRLFDSASNCFHLAVVSHRCFFAKSLLSHTTVVTLTKDFSNFIYFPTLILIWYPIPVAARFNPLKTKRRPLYLKTQSVPRCKHFSARL